MQAGIYLSSQDLVIILSCKENILSSLHIGEKTLHNNTLLYNWLYNICLPIL